MEEQEEEFEINEFFQQKGPALDALKHEYADLQKNLELLQGSNLSKERDIDYQSGELRTLREQMMFARKNIDELLSHQEVVKETIESINHKKEGLIENENQNREEISHFSSYFTELREALSVGADWSLSQLEQRGVLEKERDFLASKLENKINQLNDLRHNIDRTFEKIQHIEQGTKEVEDKMQEVDKQRNTIRHESSTLIASKEVIEKKIFDIRAQIVQGETELHEKTAAHAAEEKALKKLDNSIARTKHKMEEYINQYERLYRELQDHTAELDRQNALNEKMEIEIQEKASYIENLQSDIKRSAKEIVKTNQMREHAKEKCQEAVESKTTADAKQDALNKQIAQIRETDAPSVRREIESLDRQIVAVKQELEILKKKHLGSERASKAMVDLIQLNKNGKINLSVEIKILEEEVEHHKAQIRSMLQEKDRFEHDAEIANQQYYTALEELKLQELQIQELNKKISSDLTKLKQKQSLYESVRSDRNLYSKQLIDSQDEINALKRKFRSMNHHIDQMKEEISAKDHAIVKEHFLHHSVDKERELLKNELTKIKKQVQSSEVIIENQRVEVMKLQRIIEEADLESQRQKNELSSVLSERNLLTGQLVKRNSELNEMYEKIKIQRSNLRIGERNYNKYLESLAAWQHQLVEVVRNQSDTIASLAKLEQLRHRVIQLEKDILKEQIKARSLQDELETPMNVHRWRKLESSEPKMYEKITQIQLLQRQLVQMSDKVIQNELLIQEKEKIYVELKNVISRQPGPEVEEQILIYQQTLKDKVKQLGSMNIELEMYIEQVGKFKEDLVSIDKQMAALNKKWMKQTKINNYMA